jgi:hypothetical protein
VPLRPLLFVLAPLCLVVLYLITWWAYASTHLEQRYVPLAPGAAYEFEGTTVRVLSMTTSDRLADTKGGDTPALPGAAWVVVELEAQRADGATEFFCTFDLLGPDGRVWKPEFPAAERAVPGCRSDDITPGPAHHFEVVFQVPMGDTDQLIGIARVDQDRPTRTPVLRPPIAPWVRRP